MTPDEEPLLCCCGDHSARFVPAKKKQPSRWMVLAVKVQGHKPQVVTPVMTKEKALVRVRAACVPVRDACADRDVQPSVAANDSQVHPLMIASW